MPWGWTINTIALMMKPKSLLLQNAQDLESIDLMSGASYVGQGELSLEHFPRIQAEIDTSSGLLPSPLVWECHTWYEEVLGGSPKHYLHLRLALEIPLTCQACLKPYAQVIESDRDYLFFQTEEEAEAWDFEADHESEDALVASDSFNLLELIEDEVLLALPLAPRHPPQECLPEDLRAANARLKGAVEDIVIDKPNPFAILKNLKKQ